MNHVELLVQPQDVKGPPGMVYSTRPKVAEATDGFRYFLKGPDPRVVFAEALCYELACLLELYVPEHAVCMHPETREVLFASREKCVRSGIQELIDEGRVTNADLLAGVIVFDVWVANKDRNMGNIVGDPVHGNGRGTVTLYAIDFEKAMAVRSDDRFSVAAIDPSSLWPREDLGRLCTRRPVPGGLCDRVAGLARDVIAGTIEQTIQDLEYMSVPWRRTAEDVLVERSTKIHELVREVWDNG